MSKVMGKNIGIEKGDHRDRYVFQYGNYIEPHDGRTLTLKQVQKEVKAIFKSDPEVRRIKILQLVLWDEAIK